jgi:hypothetical protein
MTALLTEMTRDLTARLGEELALREGAKLKRQVLRSLVGATDVLARITLSAWKWVCETMEGEGFEGMELARHCKVLLDGLDGSLTGYERLLVLTEASGLTPEAAGLRDLEANLPALREARPKVAGVLNLASRPPRPADETALADSRAALDRGEFVTIDEEYLARIRSRRKPL